MNDRVDFEMEGERLLTAVERIVEDNDALIGRVEAFRQDVAPRHGEASEQHRERVASRIIASYSTRSAAAGGASALPSLLPGGGTAIALTAGAMADMAFMLKHEVEMSLCLTHLYGYDIRDEQERWLAYALVAIKVYEARGRDRYLHDVAEAQMEALERYTPRQLTKLVLTLLGKIALLSLSRSLVRALPLVGIVVGASANKILTASVGWRCAEALARRRGAGPPDEPIVDAKVD